MSADSRITTDDLTDEQIERVLNSRGFKKMLAYQQLADGISVLKDQDEIYDSMVTSIQSQHSSVSTRESVEEVLDRFVDEVEAFTKPLAEDSSETDATAADLEDIFVDEDTDAAEGVSE